MLRYRTLQQIARLNAAAKHNELATENCRLEQSRLKLERMHASLAIAQATHGWFRRLLEITITATSRKSH